jgi:phospholipase/carboxylesterase
VPADAASGRLETRPSPVAAGPAPAPGLHELPLAAGVVALLAVPPGEPAPRPLLVFCHGAGGNAAQSLGLVGRAAAAAGVAVLATTSVATTWDLVAGGLGRDVAVLDAALEEGSRQLPVSRCAVGGFSDGASYALSLGLANGDLFEAVLGFSPGFAAPPGRQGLPRIRICHGTQDRVLPVERCGRRVAGGLARAGYPVTYEEFDDGHVVPPAQVSAALTWWLAG